MHNSTENFVHILQRGLVIPAHPLALTENLKLDEKRQRALTRYYCDAGSGGVAVGVHTTQFSIRDREVGLVRARTRTRLGRGAHISKSAAGKFWLRSAASAAIPDRPAPRLKRWAAWDTMADC